MKNRHLVRPTSLSSDVTAGGNWVAQEQNGLFGGLFVNRAQAMKYALFENGHHPETIVLTANIIELDMHRKASSQQTLETIAASLQNRAA